MFCRCLGALSPQCGSEAHVERAGRIRVHSWAPPWQHSHSKWSLLSSPPLLHTGSHLGPARLPLPVLPPALCTSHSILQGCAAPCPPTPPPLSCPVILPAPASALLPGLSSHPAFHRLGGNNLCGALERRGEGGSPGTRGPGIATVFVWALQLREAGFPKAGQAARLLAAHGGHVSSKAWAGLGWQWLLGQLGPLW